MNDARGDVDGLVCLPKVVLHEHLDGGLRAATLFELLELRGIERPAADVAGLEDWLTARAHAGSLVEYLRGFALTVAAMASEDALERVAFEAVEDAYRDGCALAEFRIAPILFEPHGIPADVATAALCAGLARGRAETCLPCGLIVCGMRQQSEAEVAHSADVALGQRDAGVIGFDLAGPELGFPATLHAATLARVRAAGLPITLHAGEADRAERVGEAIALGAARIGHGVRLADVLSDPSRRHLVEAVLANDVHLEVCPTSNLHTGTAASIATHPMRALWRAGVSLSWNTDNSLLSRITMTDEARTLVDEADFTSADLVRMSREAARHSFLDERDRRSADAAIVAWAAERGLAIG